MPELDKPKRTTHQLPDHARPSEVRHTVDISPRALIKIAVALLLWWLLVKLWPVLLVVLLSLMLVATFNPLVRRLERRFSSRSLSIATILVVVALVTAGFLTLLVPVLVTQGYGLVTHAPAYAQQVHDALRRYHIRIDVVGQVERMSSRVVDNVPKILTLFGVLVETLATVITVAVLTTYLLIEGHEASNRVYRLLPRSRRLGARRVVDQLGQQVGGYMRGQLITSGLAGLVNLVLLWAIGVQEPLALAALAAVADAVPVIGLLIAMVPSALVALTLAPSKALLVVVVMLVYHQLEANLIAPRVYGNTMGLSLSVILVSLMMGYQLMGILGMFLALPVAAGLPSVVGLLHRWHDDLPEATEPSPPAPEEVLDEDLVDDAG